MVSSRLRALLREQGFAKVAHEVARETPRGVTVDPAAFTGHLAHDLGLAVAALGTKLAMDASDAEVIDRGVAAYRRLAEGS